LTPPPNKISTEEEALTAVRQDGWALKFVSKNLKTPELCLKAVKKDRQTLVFSLNLSATKSAPPSKAASKGKRYLPLPKPLQMS